MIVKDLKIGNVVKLRNGDLQVLRTDNENSNPNFYEYDIDTCKFFFECSYGVYKDNLKHCLREEYDIVEVYDTLEIYFNNKVEPIWKRNPAEDLNKGDLVWCKINSGYILRSYCRYDEYVEKYIAQSIKIDNDKTIDYDCIEFEYDEVKPYSFNKLGDK